MDYDLDDTADLLDHRIEREVKPYAKAIYELESPEVLISKAWDKAVETGR